MIVGETIDDTTIKPENFGDYLVRGGIDKKTQLPNSMLSGFGKDLLDKHNENHSDNPIKKGLKAESLVEAGRIALLQGKALSTIANNQGFKSKVNMAALLQNPISLADHPSALARLEAEVDFALQTVEAAEEIEEEEISVVGVICSTVGGWFSSKKHCDAHGDHKHDEHKNKHFKKLVQLAKEGGHHHKADDRNVVANAEDLGELVVAADLPISHGTNAHQYNMQT